MKEKNFLSSKKLVELIVEKKKQLIIVAISSLLLSTILVFILPKTYKSELVLFPAKNTSISNSLLSDNLAKKELLNFGDEDDVERLQQVFQSAEVRDKIIQKFNLMKHYDISISDKYPQTKLYEMYDDNVLIKKTQFMSLLIEVYDKENKIAADIANQIAIIGDSLINAISRERALKAFTIVENEFKNLNSNINILKDSMLVLRQLGIYDYKVQSEVFNDAYAQAISLGKLNGLKMLEEKMEVLKKHGGSYQYMKEMIEFETEKLSILKKKMAEAKIDLEQNLPNIFIVSKAYPAEREIYPIKSLIIISFLLSSILFALIVLIIIKQYKINK